MNKKVTLTIDGTPIHFDVSPDKHARLVNEMQPTSKVEPTQNFLVRCVTAESKEALKPFLEDPSHVMAIGGKLITEITSTLQVSVGE